MSVTLRRLLFLLSVVIIVLLLRIPRGYLNRNLPIWATEIARQNHAVLTIGSLDFSFPAQITVEQVGMNIRTGYGLFPFFAQKGQLDISLLRLLLIKGVGFFNIDAYSGSINGQYWRSLLGNADYLDIQIKDLSLGQHPLLDALQVEGSWGLSSSLELFPDNQNLLKIGSGQLKTEIKEGSFGGGVKLYGLVELPAVSNLNLNLEARKTATSIWLESFSLVSSLGEASGRGKLSVDKSGLPINISLTAKINLSEYGTKKLSPYLALASGSMELSSNRNWEVSISGKNQSDIRAEVKPRTS